MFYNFTCLHMYVLSPVVSHMQFIKIPDKNIDCQ